MVVDRARYIGLADLEVEVYTDIDETTAKLLYVRLNLVRSRLTTWGS